MVTSNMGISLSKESSCSLISCALHQVGTEIENTPVDSSNIAPGLILGHLCHLHPRQERHCVIAPDCELCTRLDRSLRQPGRLDLNGTELEADTVQCLGLLKVELRIAVDSALDQILSLSKPGSTRTAGAARFLFPEHVVSFYLARMAKTCMHLGISYGSCGLAVWPRVNAGAPRPPVYFCWALQLISCSLKAIFLFRRWCSKDKIPKP